jgi:hypothetical protein
LLEVEDECQSNAGQFHARAFWTVSSIAVERDSTSAM